MQIKIVFSAAAAAVGAVAAMKAIATDAATIAATIENDTVTNKSTEFFHLHFPIFNHQAMLADTSSSSSLLFSTSA